MVINVAFGKAVRFVLKCLHIWIHIVYLCLKIVMPSKEAMARKDVFMTLHEYRLGWFDQRFLRLKISKLLCLEGKKNKNECLVSRVFKFPASIVHKGHRGGGNYFWQK